MAVLSPSTIFAPGRKPPKAEIIQFLDMLQGTGSNPAVVKQTKTALDLVTPASENYGGIVLNDPDPTKNGYYYRDSAVWVKGRGLPDTFAVLTSVGGTANAITASTETGVNPADVLCVFLPDPPGTNSSSTVTLTLNGGSSESVKAASGAGLAIGDIIEGVGTLFFKVGSEWRQLFSSATGATFDHQGDYAAPTAYTEGQVVTGSDGKWYQLKDPSATGDDPVGSVTGAWLEILAAAGVADNAVTTVKILDGAVTEPKLASALTTTLTATVASYTALRAVNTARYGTAILTDAKKHGVFVWNGADLSSTLVIATETTTSITGNVCTKADHELYTGHAVLVSAAVNGLSVNTVYYAIRLSKDTFSLASTFLNARAGTAVTLTGTTNFTASRLKDAAQGVYVIKTGTALNGSAGAWVRQGPTLDACMFGAVGDASTNDLEAIQMAVDFGRAFWLLEGRHRLIGTIPTIFVDDDTKIYAVSSKSTLLYNTAVARDMIAGRKAGGGATTGNGERNFRFSMQGGMIESNGYGEAFNFLSMSYAVVRDVRGYNLYGWAKNGGTGSEGAFYNEFNSCPVVTLGVYGYRNRTLGNETKVNGGRVGNGQVGSDDDDNSGTVYSGVAFETMTNVMNRVSNSGSASQGIKFNMVRRENPNTAPYASSVGLNVGAAAQATVDIFPTVTQVATPASDSGTDTVILDNMTKRFQLPLRTTNPGGSGRMWNDAGTVKIT